MTLPVQARPAEGAGRRALLLAFAAVVMTLVLPLAGLVMSIFALIASIRAIKALRSVTKPVGIAVSGIVLSAIALLICLSVTILPVLLQQGAGLLHRVPQGRGHRHLPERVRGPARTGDGEEAGLPAARRDPVPLPSVS